jgi:hypothetical protein
MLIAVGRPYRLCLATLAGLALLAELGAIATVRHGIVGTAWAMSLGSCGVLALTGAAAFAHGSGGIAWLGHQGRLIAILSWFAAGALVAAHAPIGLPTPAELAIRGLVLAAWTLPPLWILGCRYGWGGLLRVRSGP